jgi:hypothetical protein
VSPKKEYITDKASVEDLSLKDDESENIKSRMNIANNIQLNHFATTGNPG